MKADITRDTFDPQKHRRTVRFQQGRVPIDADLNESQDLLVSRVETEARDVIGPAGGPVDHAGFGVSVNDAGDLVLSRGRYYVDGILCQLDEETVLPADAALTPDPLPTDAGHYLAYLDVWFGHLTAVEDPSMQEVALHGADTATRQEVRAQVRFLPVAAEGDGEPECGDEFPEWDDLTAAPTGTLAARAEPESAPANDCSMTPGAGYRRLENQLYRVEIHDAGNAGSATFKWSRENATILTPWLAKSGNELTVGEQGRDPHRTFRPGDWIELIDRERELCGEPGTLVQLTNVLENVLTINPTTATGTVDFGAFDTTPRVRRWESAGLLPLDHEIDGDGYSPLEYGVQVHFGTGTYHSGDYWLIPARTATGDVEWPEAGGAPAPLPRHGIRHHYARLGLLSLEADGTWSALRDCRHKFPPLGHHRCGCTLYVGDGITSFGDFNRFEDALDNLPGDGGKICFLPGAHRVTGLILNRQNVTVSSCGAGAVIRPTDEVSPAVFSVMDGTNLRFENLRIESSEGLGIYAGATQWGASSGLTIDNCTIRSGSSGVMIERWRDVSLRDARLTQEDRAFGGATLALRASKVRVEGCALAVNFDPERPLEDHAWGGIHLLGGCSGVEIHDNVIASGRGNGITLGGSLRAYDAVIRDASESDFVSMFELVARRVQDEDRAPVPPALLRDVSHTGDDGNLPLSTISLTHNRIRQCGLAGIGIIPPAVLESPATTSGLNSSVPTESIDGNTFGTFLGTFFPSNPAFYRDRIVVARIEENGIENVFLLDAPNLPTVGEYGFGGIVLGATRFVEIRQNRIANFGDPTEKAVAGIFVFAGEGLRIKENTITGSPAGDPIGDQVPGFRGGIIVRLAMKAATADTGASDAYGFNPPQSLDVSGNTVRAGRGRALTLLGFGDIRVEDNRLHAGAAGPGFFDRLCGNTLILNFGGLLEYLRLRLVGPAGATRRGDLTGLAFSNGFSATTGDGSSFNESTNYAPNAGLAQSDNYALFGVRTHLSRNRFLLEAVNTAALGQLVFSFGDVAYTDNQSVSLQAHILPMHAVLAGSQLRASDNRMSELHQLTSSSLLTGAFGHNSTVHNQGDHCIHAFSGGLGGGSVIDDDNQVLFAEFCGQIGGDGATGDYTSMVSLNFAAAHASHLTTQPEREDLAANVRPFLQDAVENHEALILTHAVPSLENGLLAMEIAENEAALGTENIFGSAAPDLHPNIDAATPTIYRERARFIRRGLRAVDEEVVNQPTPVAEGRARIEGTVLADGADGIEGATVELRPRHGGNALFEADTGSTGRFAMDLGPETVKEIERRGPETIRLVVRDRNGAILNEMDAPFAALKAGTIARGNIAVTAGNSPIERDDSREPVRPNRPPVKKTPVKKTTVTKAPTKKTTAKKTTVKKVPTKKVILRGGTSMKLEEISGIGPARARKLKEAGLDNPARILEIPDEGLANLVGTALAKRLKTAAKKHLRDNPEG